MKHLEIYPTLLSYYMNLVTLFRVDMAILVVMFVLLTSIGSVYAQDETPSPTTSQVPSLIDGDTCAPPCWFGLVAGQSTTRDAYEMLSSHEDELWNEFFEDYTNDGLRIANVRLNLRLLIEEGAVAFDWYETSFVVGQISLSSVIRTSNDQVAEIQSVPRSELTLADVFQRMGNPDTIRVGSYFYYRFLLLYYRELNMIIELTTDEKRCEKTNPLEAFHVEVVFYHTASTYRERAISELTASSFVPQSVWMNWIAGVARNSCMEAIVSLDD